MFFSSTLHGDLIRKFRLTLLTFHAALAVVTSKLPLYEVLILTRASNFVLLQPYQG
jgi:hypothetical protein